MKLLKGTPLENTRVDQKNTPKFWKKVRNIAIIVGAIAGAVATGGAALPATVVTIATILATASAAVAGRAALAKE